MEPTLGAIESSSCQPNRRQRWVAPGPLAAASSSDGANQHVDPVCTHPWGAVSQMFARKGHLRTRRLRQSQTLRSADGMHAPKHYAGAMQHTDGQARGQGPIKNAPFNSLVATSLQLASGVRPVVRLEPDSKAPHHPRHAFIALQLWTVPLGKEEQREWGTWMQTLWCTRQGAVLVRGDTQPRDGTPVACSASESLFWWPLFCGAAVPWYLSSAVPVIAGWGVIDH